MTVPARDPSSGPVRTGLKHVPGLRALVLKLRRRPSVIWVRRRCRARALRRLHDTIERTDLGGHYWVWGGMLLGWAREGQLLDHDLDDVDFGFLAADLGRLEEASPALVSAGFRLERVFRDADGHPFEFRFVRHRVRYEFFVLTPTVEGKLRYHMYDETRPLCMYDLIGEIEQQPLVPFAFLGRTWLKHADHDAELRASYGDWSQVNEAWDWRDDRAIIERRRLPPDQTHVEPWAG